MACLRSFALFNNPEQQTFVYLPTNCMQASGGIIAILSRNFDGSNEIFITLPPFPQATNRATLLIGDSAIVIESTFSNVSVTGFGTRSIQLTPPQGITVSVTFTSHSDAETTGNISIQSIIEIGTQLGAPMGSPSDEFRLEVSGSLNPITSDLIDVLYMVYDNEFHKCGLNGYPGTTIRLPSGDGSILGTRIQVLCLKVNKVIRGVGTVRTKSVEGFDIGELLLYILVKIIMGRLTLGDEIDIRWALRERYNALIAAISKSEYDNVLVYLLPRAHLENYLRWCI